ncbi:alpha/beta fold hydrolase [Candidatus Uhrbacteria bacterium]|nr:alpha/beta fold hydrolase [Candidatus Uhrbacteria bacterium]
MQKVFIQNRKGQKVAVVVDVPAHPPEADQSGKLAFVMHGLGGFKEQPHIEVMAKVFLEHGYTVVRFDTTNTFGESDGQYEEATTTNYYEDLEDVIGWAARLSQNLTAVRFWDSSAQPQPWYQEPFVLAGHSLGGLCVALYGERHPEKVKALAPIGTVVSGKLSMEGHAKDEEWRKWKETGWRTTHSVSNPDAIKRLPWSHMEDRLKYDLLAPFSPPARGGDKEGVGVGGGRMTDRLTMPTLLVVGEKDESCPPEHQKILYAALPGTRELHIISGAPHTFREPVHLEEFARVIGQWLTKI